MRKRVYLYSLILHGGDKRGVERFVEKINNDYYHTNIANKNLLCAQLFFKIDENERAVECLKLGNEYERGLPLLMLYYKLNKTVELEKLGADLLSSYLKLRENDDKKYEDNIYTINIILNKESDDVGFKKIHQEVKLEKEIAFKIINDTWKK